MATIGIDHVYTCSYPPKVDSEPEKKTLSYVLEIVCCCYSFFYPTGSKSLPSEKIKNQGCERSQRDNLMTTKSGQHSVPL